MNIKLLNIRYEKFLEDMKRLSSRFNQKNIFGLEGYPEKLKNMDEALKIDETLKQYFNLSQGTEDEICAEYADC